MCDNDGMSAKPTFPADKRIYEITWKQWQVFFLMNPAPFFRLSIRSPILIYVPIAKFTEGWSLHSLVSSLLCLFKSPLVADNNNIIEKVPCNILANLIALFYPRTLRFKENWRQLMWMKRDKWPIRPSYRVHPEYKQYLDNHAKLKSL